jgi:CHAD domain-containing protein
MHSIRCASGPPACDVVALANVDLVTGFQRIAEHCVIDIRRHEAGLVHGTDPESVHLMRVGLRRLRSALRLFSPWIPLPADLRTELEWLGDALGNARDAEVLATSTLPTRTTRSMHALRGCWQAFTTN